MFNEIENLKTQYNDPWNKEMIIIKVTIYINIYPSTKDTEN